MSWTYSGNPADSPIDECRFLIGDTNEDEPIMQDEEIQYIIDTYGPNDNQIKFQLIKRTLGPQSEDPTDRLNFYKQQAASYKAKLAASGLSLPKNAYPKVFRKGMQNNPPWPPPKRRY